MKNINKIMVAIPQKPILKGEHGRWGIPYGAMRITQELKENGFNATLYDFGAASNENSGISKNFISEHGTSNKEIKKILLDENPDILAISIPFTYLWNNSEKLINTAKQILPNVKIILGGNHTEAYREIQNLPIAKNIDAIVRGTNPKTIINILDSFDFENKKGICITEKGKTNISQFKPHDYSLIDINQYSGKNHMNIPINGKGANYLFTIGCNNACTYCQAPIMHGKQKSRSLEIIEKDFKNLSLHGIDNLIIFDDNIIDLPISSVKELFNLGKKYFSALHLEGGIETSKLTEEFADLFYNSNVKSAYLAVETPNISLMNKLSEKFTSKQEYLKHVNNVTKLLRDRNIVFYTNSMCGWPEETEKEIQEGIDFQRWLKEECGASWVTSSTVTPFPGTVFYNQNKHLIAKGMDWQTNSKEYYLCGGSAKFNGKDITAYQIGKKLHTAYEKINGKKLPMSPNPYW